MARSRSSPPQTGRPPVRRIDTANDELQLTLSLRSNRRQRQRQGRFLVEGVRAINQSVAAGWPLDSLWYARGRPLSSWARGLLDAGLARAHYEVAPTLMAELSEKDEASELIAVAEIPADDLERIALPDSSALLVVFDRPVSPGNLGSVIRSSDALGANGLVVTGHAADVYDPQTVRASLGSLFALPVVRAAGPRQVVEWLGRRPPGRPALRIVGSSARGTTGLDELDLTGPVVLVVGNETRGLSDGWRELCDDLAAIPMQGSASSLNAAAAAAILLYEVDRQRGRARPGGERPRQRA
jgi:TrmH family RNA methyltransferase